MAPLEPVAACLACGSSDRDAHHETAAMMDASAQRFRFSRCRACGLVYLDPRVPAGDLGRYYTDAYLPYRGPEAWGRWRGLVASGLRATDRRRVARVRALGAIGPASRVLDVGCGHPTFLEALQGESGCEAVGVDFSDEGWRGDPARWSGLELHAGELADVALTGAFDLVTMWHYLEHDYAPADTLRRVRGLVGDSAHLVIEVPDHDSWSRRRYGPHWAGYHTPRHTALWDPSTMRVLLEGAGWRVESIEPLGTLDPWTLVWMSRQERRGIDWSASMERYFAGFVAGRVISWPVLSRLEKARGRGGDGFLTAVARPA
ncbi:MAG: class I SAM-dependent methyltransferase [Gemmatimonadetes bacterium]|nr:class I SAM-dependent methyltransferase [Gemmatimonadota bacterium]NNF37266.1 class I SAM-dependent methyltransferase [Gemmatimonadota bacterium]